MIWHRCDLKLPSLFGPACCGREATTYDRARKAWLCPEHTKERLCEFCQFERAWVRFCYREHDVTCEIWLCVECAGLTGDGEDTTASNQFLPVTRPLSFTGERERCSVLVQGGDASAWPPFCLIVAYKHREEKRDTETMGRLVTQRFRPTRPPGRSGPLDRTAGGIGGAAPASLDLYGQSRTNDPKSLTASHRQSFHAILRDTLPRIAEEEGNDKFLCSGPSEVFKAGIGTTMDYLQEGTSVAHNLCLLADSILACGSHGRIYAQNFSERLLASLALFRGFPAIAIESNESSVSA
jgi:hypothetical protein